MSLCRNLTKLCRNFVIRFFARNYSKSFKIFHPSPPIPPKNSLPPPLKLFSSGQINRETRNYANRTCDGMEGGGVGGEVGRPSCEKVEVVAYPCTGG